MKDQVPAAFRVLAEMDSQSLGGTVHRLELYDLRSDPDEMHNLVDDPSTADHCDRLHTAVRVWTQETEDPAVNIPELSK